MSINAVIQMEKKMEEIGLKPEYVTSLCHLSIPSEDYDNNAGLRKLVYHLLKDGNKHISKSDLGIGVCTRLDEDGEYIEGKYDYYIAPAYQLDEMLTSDEVCDETFWDKVGSSKFKDIIKTGYKLGFIDIPVEAYDSEPELREIVFELLKSGNKKGFGMHKLAMGVIPSCVIEGKYDYRIVLACRLEEEMSCRRK